MKFIDLLKMLEGLAEATTTARGSIVLSQKIRALKLDPNVEWRNGEGKTLLHVTQNPQLVLCLLIHRFDPMERDGNPDEYGKTPLHYCTNPEVAKLLLDHGAEPMAADNDGRTPLDLCTSPAVREVLLAHGAIPIDREELLKAYDEIDKIQAADDRDDDSLDGSSFSGEIDEFDIGPTGPKEYEHGEVTTDYCKDYKFVVSLFAHGANPNVKDKEGRTPLHYCNDLEYTKILLAHGAQPNVKDKEGNTPLHNTSSALISQDIEREIELFLSRQSSSNPSPDSEDDDYTDDSSTVFAPSWKNSDVMKALILHGADPLAKNKEGDTPLHLCHTPGAARVLLDSKADCMARNNDGCTPLHLYCYSKVTRVLLQHGADPNSRDAEGKTPLFGMKTDDTVRVLLAHGADPLARSLDGSTMVDTHSLSMFPNTARILLAHGLFIHDLPPSSSRRLYEELSGCYGNHVSIPQSLKFLQDCQVDLIQQRNRDILKKILNTFKAKLVREGIINPALMDRLMQEETDLLNSYTKNEMQRLQHEYTKENLNAVVRKISELERAYVLDNIRPALEVQSRLQILGMPPDVLCSIVADSIESLDPDGTYTTRSKSGVILNERFKHLNEIAKHNVLIPLIYVPILKIRRSVSHLLPPPLAPRSSERRKSDRAPTAMRRIESDRT